MVPFGESPRKRITAWHAGQHLRQVYDLLETDTFPPPKSLPMELFEGLPMLDEVW